MCMVGEGHTDTQRPVNFMTISPHDDGEGGLILIVMNNMAAARQEEALCAVPHPETGSYNGFISDASSTTL